MKVIKIPYDLSNPCTIHDIPNRVDDSIEASGRVLDDIKKLIDIDMAEIVYLSTVVNKDDPHRDYCLIVDEVGKCKDGWEERINIRASLFYPGTAHGDPIVGDVAFCAREWTDSFGECDLTGLLKGEIIGFIAKIASFYSGQVDYES